MNRDRDHETLSRQLDEIAGWADDATLGTLVPDRSAWSVGQHLDHVLKVADYFFQGILRPDDVPPRRPISFLGRVVVATGYIPRGRGKAPERVVGQVVTAEGLRVSLAATRETLRLAFERLATLPERPQVRHPYFGGLTPLQAFAFARIHTHHHLKIARELLAAR